MRKTQPLFTLVLALAVLALLPLDVQGKPDFIEANGSSGTATVKPDSEQPFPTDVPDQPAPPTESMASGPHASDSTTTDRYEHVGTLNVASQGPGGMTIGPEGRIYAADSARDVVMILDPDGRDRGTIDYSGLESRDGVRDDIAVDAEGFVYVLVTSRTTGVARYSPDGQLVSFWSDGVGERPSRRVTPKAIAVDDRGVVYVAENLFGTSTRVRTFTNDGEFVAEWTWPGDRFLPHAPLDIEAAGDRVYLLGGGYRRNAPVSLLTFSHDGEPLGKPIEFPIASRGGDVRPFVFDVGKDGNVIVGDPLKRVVAKISPDGGVLARWSISGDPDRTGRTLDVAVGRDGHVYVADARRGLIEVFRPVDDDASVHPAPTLVITPRHVTSEMDIAAYGRHFATESPVTLTLVGRDGTTRVPIEDVVTDDKGFFRAAIDLHGVNDDCASPEIGLDGVNLMIEAVGDGHDGTPITANITLFSTAHAPTLTVTPSEDDCGDGVTVTGTNFGPGSRVSISSGIPGGHRFVPVGHVEAVNLDGTFSLEGDILPGECPNLPPGVEMTYVVNATTDRGAVEQGASHTYPSASATFTFVSSE